MPARGTGGSGRGDLDKYLLPDEHVVTEIRHHGIVLTKPVLIMLAATVLVVWIDINVSDANASILGFTRFAWLAVLVWGAWQVFEWRHTRLVVSEKRIVLFHGWITRRVSMMPMAKVTDMSYHRSILGRILGYGKFVLESAGQDQALSSIDFVPKPDQNYRAICAQIFGSDDPDDHLSDDGYEDEWDDEDEEPPRRRRGRRRQPQAGRLVDEQTEVPFGPHILTSARGRVGITEHARSSAQKDPSIYRSEDLKRRDRTADTGELPPYRAPHDTGELPDYDPDWRP